MPFLSEAASAIKSRFRFHDHPSESLSLVQNTPDLLKSAAKDNLVQSSAVRNINSWDDEGGVGPSSTAVSSNQSFEICEDPSFWKDHNVQVIIRMRPLSNSEISLQGYNKCVRQESCQTITWTGHPESRFTFDLVADENVSQEKLFKVAGLPMVENCMGGYNSCMFAYGQTGSGKTHTMLGDIEGGTRRHSVNCGMTPRIFEHLFSRIQKDKEARRDEKIKFTCKCSFLEIYNEQILDLLDPSSNNLQIREDNKKGVYVENIKEVEVTNARDVIQQLIQGAANRKVAATNMNCASSRSHSVFTCIVESQWEFQGVTHFRFARLNLVDLAGSERQKSSGAEGERLKEATNINKSLSTLGLVIMNLVSISNGKSLHVPYRDSKLTFLLQDSLGGNSKTIIIANISPSTCCSLETLSTLKFAQRAKFIKNNAIVNEDASGDVIAMRIQIQQLKKEVSRLRGLAGGGENQDNDISAISFPGSPGSFKWESAQGSFSPLNSIKRTSQKKDYEIALVGAFRREKDKEMMLQALRDENQAAMKLAKQREDEIQGLKMRLRFREAGIKRLEAVASGKISAETHLLNEKEEHLKEIEVLRAQVDRSQEVTRFAMENLQLKEEIRRLKSFYEEGEREMMNEQIMMLQNKLLEALDWKLMHEPDQVMVQKAYSDSMMEEDIQSDGNLISKQELSPKSRWQSSLREENEFLRIQAIQNQAEMDTIRKKLEVCLGEKEKLERRVDDLAAQLEQEKPKATKEAREQMDLPSTTDTPDININDQAELEAMVAAIAAANAAAIQREAEAHETAIMLTNENDEFRMKVKALIEDNSKLIELYEQATAENHSRNVNKGENAREIGSKGDIGSHLLETRREEETELKRMVENLQHQLMEIKEENEKLLSLYERAMQERDDLKRTLSCSRHERVETKGEMDCPEKLVEVDGGERDLAVESVSQEAQEGRGESKYVERPTISGSGLCLVYDGQEEEKLLKGNNEVDFLVNSDMDIEVSNFTDMDIEVSNFTEKNLSEELNCATKKLERVDERISDAVRTLASLGCAEKAMVQVDKLSREIEVTEHDIQVKREQFESLKPLLSEAEKRRTLVDNKFSALKYSLSNFSSTFSYFEQREARARAGVNDLTSYIDRKKGELAALQATKKGLENAQKKNQESEVELVTNIACIKSKLEEENRKRESEKVLFAIDNTQNMDPSLKNWHLSGKATELLKLEEEKTKLQGEMKISQEKLGFIRKELGNLNKKVANVESQIQGVQLEIQQGLKNADEKELALQRVMKEKEMLLEFRDNGMFEMEHMIIELQQCVFEYDLKEAEIKILGEELQTDFIRTQELQTARVIAANNKNNHLSSVSHLGMFEKIEEEMQNLRASILETKLLLEDISHAT
ncbi:kinesin-like protein KIN-12E [Gastrolobium bilobum]|uniref:kinesin-like protein KIN-12E n=1 Tax=Gastrolobium bilobum TaxID=150636 RepID=UPI002AB2263C|nr:kinesin-like protein KIN-12E [Gastrolobium bilobum]